MSRSFPYSQVRAFAPATVANVSCGFDVMGFALDNPGDEIIVRATDTGAVTIRTISGDKGQLPADPEKNTAGVAVSVLLQHLDIKTGIEIEVHKQMPLGSGLGSSAASAAGAVLAASHLIGSPLERSELLPFAAEGERIACGTAHYDNVGPSLMGGFIFIRSSDPPDIFHLPYPDTLHAAVVRPQIEIKTGDTRKILRKEIPLSRAVTQWGNIGGLVAGLYAGDMELVSRSMEDVIIEPIRSVLIPGYDAVKQAALAHGAIGAGIAGSGPSIFALAPDRETAEKVAKAMNTELDSIGLPADRYISAINKQGAEIIDAR